MSSSTPLDLSASRGEMHEARAWTVRPATVEDRPAIAQLMSRVFNREEAREGSSRRWDWLFLENTADSRMFYLVADAGERLAGQYAMMPARLQHEGKIRLGLLSLDTATHPDFERQGIFTTLARQLYEESADEGQIVFGFPNANSAPAFYRKLGWVELSPLPLLIRPLGNPREAIRAWKPPLAPFGNVIALATPLLRAFEHLLKLTGERNDASVRPFDSFSKWADDLWAELAPSLGTCSVRDAAFLNWRFCSGPSTYRRYALHRGERPVGFAVTALRTWGAGKLAYLMELMVPRRDAPGARLLLAQAFLDAARDGATAIATLTTRRHPHRRAMLQAGFVPVPERFKPKLSFGVRQNGPDVVPNKLFHIDDWYISGADLDVI